MRVLMIPGPIWFDKDESGIKRVVEAYIKGMPEFGVEIVGQYPADLTAAHAGMILDPDVLICHGLYWTADYQAAAWEWHTNNQVIEAARRAKQITVPSQWVADTFKRDMHISPTVIGHGIDWEDWQEQPECEGYVLWNKNRASDVCNPLPAVGLAKRFADVQFVSTFGVADLIPNMTLTGIMSHEKMKATILRAGVYLSTTKETFGIGTLEAMAAGVPILGYAWGGNLDLVKHGVNGYLAQPGNEEDLATGLAYCFAHRKVLGENGREMAKAWTWRAACQKMAKVFEKALGHPEPTVSIVIPSYNYASKVGRAIRSALAQDHPLLQEVIVVDDGSEDNGATGQAVKAFTDPRVRYVRKDNGGVATARNKGIELSTSKYICCLDADDAIETDFISTCIKDLENDRALGIAYTGLLAVTPDGKATPSQWPGAFDYEMQLARRNQVPTACVFRKSMWERLGGYRQRYAPAGAGAEDAEFWLRAGAYGFGAKQATERHLFVYSWKSGRVSGDKNYREVDWTSWHPWVRDGLHPFASLAKPKGRFSHPVRQYDQPAVSVVIPVGPSHAKVVWDALDSLEAQTFRKWEAVVVWDGTKFEKGERERIETAFPFAKFVKAKAPHGAGRARNIGAREARAPFLLFLDADDWLVPSAIERLFAGWEASPAIIYSDYIGIAQVDDPQKLSPDLQGHLYSYEGGIAVMGYRSAEYDCQRAQQQPNKDKPYLWCNVTALIPKAWHEEAGGFDEKMPSWEDWDYWIRLARLGKCFTRLPEELLVYRFTTGQRREMGLQDKVILLQYMADKYAGMEADVCSGCGGNKKKVTGPPPSYPAGVIPAAGKSLPASSSDGDYILCEYVHPNRGDHSVIGMRTRTNYGYRSGGQLFLVHRADIEGQPHLFVPIPQEAPAPALPTAELGAPKPLR